MKKFKKLVPVAILCLVIVLIISNVSFIKIFSLPNDIYVDYSEIENANNNNYFGSLVRLEMNNKELNTGDVDGQNSEVVFKLFGLLPIKKVSVKILPEEEVYVGGMPIGLNLKTDGAVVISDSVIDPRSAKVMKNKYIQSGDVIKQINEVEICCVDDLTNALESAVNDEAEVKVIRNNKEIVMNVPLIKNSDQQYKLGVWVKDDFAGVGTLTFVKSDSNDYGALGHGVTSGNNEGLIPMTIGEIYSCNLVNIEKGQKNKPGELQCVFVERNKKGTIEKNTNVGIFGHLDNAEALVDTNKTAKLGGRLSVKMGQAKLISSVSGISEEYDIEIIKTNYQSKCSDKSFVFRVKDERLIVLTGGIVQGMSGSPIVQDGKVVGAVTHVFINDSTKGYGVYTDWMLENLES